MNRYHHLSGNLLDILLELIDDLLGEERARNVDAGRVLERVEVPSSLGQLTAKEEDVNVITADGHNAHQRVAQNEETGRRTNAKCKQHEKKFF